MRTLQTDLLNEDFEGILRILKSVPDLVTNEEQFVTFIYDVSFPKWLYEEIPQMESEYLKLIWLFYVRHYYVIASRLLIKK